MGTSALLQRKAGGDCFGVQDVTAPFHLYFYLGVPFSRKICYINLPINLNVIMVPSPEVKILSPLAQNFLLQGGFSAAIFAEKAKDFHYTP